MFTMRYNNYYAVILILMKTREICLYCVAYMTSKPASNHTHYRRIN